MVVNFKVEDLWSKTNRTIISYRAGMSFAVRHQVQPGAAQEGGAQRTIGREIICSPNLTPTNVKHSTNGNQLIKPTMNKTHTSSSNDAAAKQESPAHHQSPAHHRWYRSRARKMPISATKPLSVPGSANAAAVTTAKAEAAVEKNFPSRRPPPPLSKQRRRRPVANLPQAALAHSRRTPGKPLPRSAPRTPASKSAACAGGNSSLGSRSTDTWERRFATGGLSRIDGRTRTTRGLRVRRKQ